MNKKEPLYKAIAKVFDSDLLQFPKKEIMLRRSFTEAWFSDTLAWLLDPKGSHGYGVKFAKGFLQEIAKERVNKNRNYKRRAFFLKFGQQGSGKFVNGFSLKNASSIRELYMPQSLSNKKSNGGKYCDVAFMDLDINDGLMVMIENKLFTHNHPGQLTEYYQLSNDKFSAAQVREFVYLTLDGVPPLEHAKSKEDFSSWVLLSWIDTVPNILNKTKIQDNHQEVDALLDMLNWMKLLKNIHIPEHQLNLNELQNILRIGLLEDTLRNFLAELNRLGDNKAGEWKAKKEIKKNSFKLIHTSAPKRILYVELLKNFTITVHSKRKSNAYYEKIIVPFGVHPDQVFNLMDIAARDVYYKHFGDSVHRYLSRKRRLSKTQTEAKKAVHPTFDFVYKYRNELKVLLALDAKIINQPSPSIAFE